MEMKAPSAVLACGTVPHAAQGGSNVSENNRPSVFVFVVVVVIIILFYIP